VSPRWRLLCSFVPSRVRACGPLLVLFLVAAGCQSGPPARATAPAAAQPAATPKKVTAVIRGTPKVLSVAIDSAGAGQTKGLSEIEQLVNNGLAAVDNTGELQPRLAEAVPTTENGLWKVLPDGRMETTWNLRQNAAWQDGSPLTAADLIFTAAVARDKSLAIVSDPAFDAIEALDAPDPRTLVVTWSKPFIDADRLFTNTDSTTIMPMPQHLLGQAYAGDHDTFLDLSYWNRDFVGAGPFKLSAWVPDSHLILIANDLYVLGRPKIDEIDVKFIDDASVTVANILAGAVDLTLRAGLSFEQGQQLTSEWQEGRVERSFSALPTLFPQFINPVPAAVADVRFRRAVTMAMDRRQLSQTFGGGGPVADSPYPPGTSEYRAVEQSIVRYGFDPRSALQLLDTLGYTRGSDGSVRDGSQQELSVEIQTTIDDLRQKLVLAIRDYWQKVGVGVDPVIVPRQASKDRELRATFSGFDFTVSPSVPTRFESSSIPLPKNGFRGNNRSRYSNPDLDTLIAKYFVTIPKQERLNILGEMVHIQTDQLVTIGIFFVAEPAAVSNRLRNYHPPTQRDGTLSWNAQEWDLT